VIALFTHLPQALFKLAGCERRVHSVISIPS
jgi:hypothetical protein